MPGARIKPCLLNRFVCLWKLEFPCSTQTPASEAAAACVVPGKVAQEIDSREWGFLRYLDQRQHLFHLLSGSQRGANGNYQHAIPTIVVAAFAADPVGCAQAVLLASTAALATDIVLAEFPKFDPENETV